MCRSAVSKFKGPGDGMDSGQVHFQKDSPSSSSSVGRSICHKVEQSTRNICLPIPGPSGVGDRCTVNRLEQSSSLCLPTNSSTLRGNEPSSEVISQTLPCSTLLADSVMVSDNAESTSGFPNRSATQPQTVETTAEHDLSQQSGHAKPPRVAIIQRRIRQAGFSEKVANLAAAPQRRSSLRLYQSYYDKFSNWCNQADICPSTANVLDLAEFLVYLYEVQKLSPRTIANYRSALAPTVSGVDGFAPNNHPCLSALLKSFFKSTIPKRVRIPDWDLSFVLQKLRSPPFEPLVWGDKDSRTRVTVKTVFLLSLASARRRGELQALSRDARDLIFSKKGVHLRTVAGFLPKSAVLKHDPKPFYIPRLTPFSGKDSDDRLLCPVRSLFFYLSSTGGHKPEERLFCKIVGQGQVSAQTVSAWIVKCIKMCHNDNDSVHAHAHEVRRIAASWAYKGGVHSIEDILSAGTWANHTTFSSYYLADVRHQSNNRFRIHPVIAGNQVTM